MTLTAFINPVVPLNLLFPLQRVICPQSCQSAKYRIVTHNFTNEDLTNGKSPSYQSLVIIPPTPLRSPLRSITGETPVPATRNLSSVPVFPAEPAPFLFLHKKPRSPSVKFSTSSISIKSRCLSQNLPVSCLPQRIIPTDCAQKVYHFREGALQQAVIIFPCNGRK